MTAAVFTEAQHSFDGLISAHHMLSIDEVIIGPSQTILVGGILGAVGVVSDDTITGSAGAGNVGTSTIGSLSATTQSINGVYNVVLLTAGATGEFEVGRPDGTIDGTGKIGTAYAGAVNFLITTGGSPAVGDTFAVAVTRQFDEAGEQFEAWNPAATDGSQSANAIALQAVTTASGQTAKIAALRRDGAFRANAVNWKSGSTAAQQALAQAQLEKRDIVLR